MKHDKLKISKIADELMTYCFSMGATNISINVQETEEYYRIQLKSNYKGDPDQKVNKLCKLLKCANRSVEMEEYYWYLTGDSDVDSELSLVSMMIDEANIEYNEGKDIEISLFRYK